MHTYGTSGSNKPCCSSTQNSSYHDPQGSLQQTLAHVWTETEGLAFTKDNKSKYLSVALKSH